MLYMLAFIFALILFEVVLCALWSPFYFRSGIPVYRRTFAIGPGTVSVPTARQFHAALPDSGRSAPILVQPIGESSFAFRENMLHFGLSMTSIMRGMINYDLTAGTVEVRGYSNWSTIVLTCYVVFFVMNSDRSSFDLVAPVYFVGLVLLYWQQRKRFVQVEETVRKLSGQENQVH